MQIKASRDNPSVIDGKWNPLVKTELIQRLKTKGIDPEKNSVDYTQWCCSPLQNRCCRCWRFA